MTSTRLSVTVIPSPLPRFHGFTIHTLASTPLDTHTVTWLHTHTPHEPFLFLSKTFHKSGQLVEEVKGQRQPWRGFPVSLSNHHQEIFTSDHILTRKLIHILVRTKASIEVKGQPHMGWALIRVLLELFEMFCQPQNVSILYTRRHLELRDG